jgi:hypothetical protein
MVQNVFSRMISLARLYELRIFVMSKPHLAVASKSILQDFEYFNTLRLGLYTLVYRIPLNQLSHYITSCFLDGKIESDLSCIPPNPYQLQFESCVMIDLIHSDLGLQIKSNLIHNPLGPFALILLPKFTKCLYVNKLLKVRKM